MPVSPLLVQLRLSSDLCRSRLFNPRPTSTLPHPIPQHTPLQRFLTLSGPPEPPQPSHRSKFHPPVQNSTFTKPPKSQHFYTTTTLSTDQTLSPPSPPTLTQVPSPQTTPSHTTTPSHIQHSFIVLCKAHCINIKRASHTFLQHPLFYDLQNSRTSYPSFRVLHFSLHPSNLPMK